MITNCQTAPRNAEDGGQGGGDGENVVDAAAGGLMLLKLGQLNPLVIYIQQEKWPKEKMGHFRRNYLMQ